MESFEMNLIRLAGGEHDEEIVRYGLCAVVDGVITILIIMLLGILVNRKVHTIIYLLMSFIGTGAMGGYHCNTRKCCLIVTIAMWIICSFCPEVITSRIGNTIIYLSLMVSFFLVVLLAPAEHKNKPLRTNVYRKNKVLSRFWDLFISVLIVLL